MTQYPKIEIYTEVDKGDPNAGNQTWTDPLGNKVYGGAADYRPYIQRRTILLDEEQKKQLLELSLSFLPYFKEQKPALTLGQYFEASTRPKSPEFRQLFPKDLEGLYSQNKSEHYDYFSTLILFEKPNFYDLTVVWLNETTWYTDDVYYRLEGLDELIKSAKLEEDLPMEGRLKDFLRYSPLLQRKLTEGFTELRPITTQPTLPANSEIFYYELSPGMPNTSSYRLHLNSDGNFIYYIGGVKKTATIDPTRVTALILKTLHLDWKRYAQQPSGPPANDKQTISMTVWHEGNLYELHDPYFSDEADPLYNFRNFAMELFQPELQK